MKNTIDLRVQKTNSLLSKALSDVMQKKPFEKITVSDICRAAMVHRTTFYNHFTDKYDLLNYMMNDLLNVFDCFNIENKSFDEYKSYCMKVAQVVINHITENISMFKLLLIQNKDERIISNFRSVLTQKIYEKLLKFDDNGTDLPIPAPIIANMYAGGCISVITWWIENDSQISSSDLLKYFDMMIRPID
ncbi:MAG: TetR/AcrR family transcriptional regulator [Clostridia bacterium]|nr:TetR/AcrR family transcriptional regulator [Clostridia bacterium]